MLYSFALSIAAVAHLCAYQNNHTINLCIHLLRGANVDKISIPFLWHLVLITQFFIPLRTLYHWPLWSHTLFAPQPWLTATNKMLYITVHWVGKWATKSVKVLTSPPATSGHKLTTVGRLGLLISTHTHFHSLLWSILASFAKTLMVFKSLINLHSLLFYRDPLTGRYTTSLTRLGPTLVSVSLSCLWFLHPDPSIPSFSITIGNLGVHENPFMCTSGIYWCN